MSLDPLVYLPLPFPVGYPVSPIQLYANGDPSSDEAPYQLVFGATGSDTIYLQPIGTPTQLEAPVQVRMFINASLLLTPYDPTLNWYFFQAFYFNNTLYGPPIPSNPVTITIPTWLFSPYWVQGIIATENRSVAYMAPSKGGWPTVDVPMASLLFPDNQSLVTVNSNTGDILPSLFAQIEISFIDVSFIGNQSTGRILDTISTSIDPNTFSYDFTPNFRRATLQGATDLTGRASVQYGITDRNGQPFLSLVALYDITTQTVIEAAPRTNNNVQTVSSIY